MTPRGSALRGQIEAVLATADALDAAWADVLEETGDRPPVKAWEADDDARRTLAYDAVAVLRNLLDRIDEGGDLDLAPPAPEVIFMVWDGGPAEEEHLIVDAGGGQSRILDHGQVFSVCPGCFAVNGGLYEVDECERWNPAEMVIQPDESGTYGPLASGRGWGWLGTQPNPLAGLPMLGVHEARQEDFNTSHHLCQVCSKRVSLPEWVESNW